MSSNLTLLRSRESERTILECVKCGGGGVTVCAWGDSIRTVTHNAPLRVKTRVICPRRGVCWNRQRPHSEVMWSERADCSTNRNNQCEMIMGGDCSHQWRFLQKLVQFWVEEACAGPYLSRFTLLHTHTPLPCFMSVGNFLPMTPTCNYKEVELRHAQERCSAWALRRQLYIQRCNICVSAHCLTLCCDTS